MSQRFGRNEEREIVRIVNNNDCSHRIWLLLGAWPCCWKEESSVTDGNQKATFVQQDAIIISFGLKWTQ